MADLAQGLKDFLFPARVALRDAAEGQKPATPATPASPGIDVAAEAQKAAKRSLPVTTPTAPVVKKPKALGTASKIGSQLMEQ